MLFSELLRSAGLAAVPSGGDPEINDVQFHPRSCGKGSCFVAMRGPTDDGHRHIPEAAAAGASAVVCRSIDGSAPPGAYVVVEDTRLALGRLAQALRGWPARKLKCAAVTGTNGKTTVTYMLRAVLERAGFKPGLLGTVSYQTGQASQPAVTTTPDPVTLADLMARMVAAGGTHLVMEASSHALDQQRTAGLDFDAAVYTNLTGDHLDYHGDMEAYLAAKLRLFEAIGPSSSAVINGDDPYADRVAEATRARVIRYGLDSDAGVPSRQADVRARVSSVDASGSRFAVLAFGHEVLVSTPVIGRHNVLNCLAAAGAAIAMGVDLAAVSSALGDLEQVPGRLERVRARLFGRGAPDGPGVFVDYAHTDDALQNVLLAIRPLAAGRVTLVFGCGGDRDATKRPRMAAVAERLADSIVVTSDNPRSEDPQEIIRQILSGLGPAGAAKTAVQIDRRLAIEQAISQADPADVVLIAGKGHEKYQIIAGRQLPFDDVEVAAGVLLAREARR